MKLSNKKLSSVCTGIRVEGKPPWFSCFSYPKAHLWNFNKSKLAWLKFYFVLFLFFCLKAFYCETYYIYKAYTVYIYIYIYMFSSKISDKLNIFEHTTWRSRELPEPWCVPTERLLLNHANTPGFLAPRRRRIQSGARDEAWSLRAFV